VALKEAQADVTRMKRTYDERRRFMIQRLRELGLGITVEPTGAFLCVRQRQAPVRRLVQAGLRHPGESLRRRDSGNRFRPKGGEGYLRFSYANSLDNIKEGLNRLERYIRQYH
jgi:aspartate/methionine/tyrosine aminotransferase